MFWIPIFVILGLCATWLYHSRKKERKPRTSHPTSPSTASASVVDHHKSPTSRKKQKLIPPRKPKSPSGNVAKHELQAGVIPTQKSPTTCVAVSACGQKVATADRTGTVRVFAVGDDGAANLGQTFWGVLDNDFPIAMDFSPAADSLYLILDLRRNLVKVKLERGELNRLPTVFAGEPDIHKGIVTWLCSSRGPFVVTCCRGAEDTAIKVWDSASGEAIGSYDTKQVKIHDFAYTTADARFVTVAAWSSGVQVLEVKRKGTNVTKFAKAMDLKTNCGILAVALSADHRRALVLKKGGMYCLFDIDVRYEAGERTKVIQEIPEEDENFQNTNSLSYVDEDRIVMCISGPHIKFMDATNFQTIQVIEHAHPSDITFTNVTNDSLILTYCRSHKPRIWRTPKLV